MRLPGLLAGLLLSESKYRRTTMGKQKKDRRKKQRLRQVKREVRIAEVNAIHKHAKDLGRECGSCIACCTTMGVPELGKKSGVKCPHVCGKGCSIYETRPDSCRGWNCLWVAGYLPEALKPEKCGVIWDDSYHSMFDQKMFTARELRPRALEEKENQAWLADVISRVLVLVMTHDGKKSVLGPKEKVAQLEAYILRKSEKQGIQIGVEQGIQIDVKPT
jgi:uncharacterized protein